MSGDIFVLVVYFAGLALVGTLIHFYALGVPTTLTDLEGTARAETRRLGITGWKRPALAAVPSILFVLLVWGGLAIVVPPVGGPGVTAGLSPTGVRIDLIPPAGESAPVYGAILSSVFLAGALVFRRAVFFPFFAFHAAFGTACLVVDFLGSARVENPSTILEHSLTAAFVLLILSHALVGSLVRTSGRTLPSGLLAAFVSGLAFCIAVGMIARMASVSTETGFLFAIYFVLAFGILMPHVFALSLVVQSSD